MEDFSKGELSTLEDVLALTPENLGKKSLKHIHMPALRSKVKWMFSIAKLTFIIRYDNGPGLNYLKWFYS